MVTNIFITGKMNSGKSTLIKNIIADYNFHVGGFYIQELFYENKRVAYRMVDYSEDKSYNLEIHLTKQLYDNLDELSNIIGRYNGEVMLVKNPSVFEEFGFSIINKLLVDKPVLAIIDELGRIELPALNFQNKIFELLDSNIIVLGILKKELNCFIDKIINRDDVKIIDLDRVSSHEIKREIYKFIDIQGSSRKTLLNDQQF